ncbi:DUF768 domain-containing protein [Mesorhizobium sp. M2A.F.Ca.ET.037.01.1.1]|uniref:DUF768 domain-containing protein n=1 Tax=unclassified Mesorhizobium TaxID=325217 RepID=UPI000F76095D|nr:MULTISPECIES: DUF768 domain-containing protein [unclassified Mesorhizobium]RVC71195.1 DUF768 domain-containing protein [Mesorhizobium sp. M00.F.Ca.ET.038.03.1.1]RVC81281.1 DUF768 domain-containing protein [Mesorhizobium sp. M2A.F.Ca.ET.046.02.1.1]AZO34702.1 DUF768 domain-containing protein [Mesorhizobium sp. M2A.F.Ca.ET.046.03.2.1]RUX23250.1 DUF768 domain-containing protein [Mesorhizobium sp. M2A.F.Ca.ET.037.01.1.1]RWA92929.1 MAG: DUF768 domain-containing protein [Mesorhizobium sp.]
MALVIGRRQGPRQKAMCGIAEIDLVRVSVDPFRSQTSGEVAAGGGREPLKMTSQTAALTAKAVADGINSNEIEEDTRSVYQAVLEAIRSD